jgi:signal transduction histidine kinase
MRPPRRWLRAAWPALRRRLAAGRPAERQAPSWLRAAREASDVRSFQDALRRLAASPTELVVGSEPPPLPAVGGRFGHLRPYRAPLLWLATVGMFLMTTEMLLDRGGLWEILVPVAAALIALPLGLSASTPLRAWRLQVLVALAAPVIVPPVDYAGPPWPTTLVLIGLYVTYTVAVRVELHLLVGVWLVTDVTIVLGHLATGAGADALNRASTSIILATIVIAYGYLIGTRRRLQRELVEGRRREQEQQARSSLLEERARIARELHDVVAHHMSVIAVRAETAPFRIPDLPAAVKEDMAETSAIAREALTEMRRLLGVLRGADSGAVLAPQPGMDRLEALVAAVRGAGLAVELRIAGAQRRLPAGVELSAYRILQEALSNALRHAPGAHATVEVHYEPSRLRLRVHNDPPPARNELPPPAPPGHGIIGMRERAAMLGGTLTAAPTAEGGYLVEADLPLERSRGDREGLPADREGTAEAAADRAPGHDHAERR